MDNPYQAPKSNIENGIVEPKSKTAWKVYFWIIILLYPLLTISLLMGPEAADTTAIDLIITFFIYPIVLLGIFGFAYDKRFFTARFWKIWIVVSIASDIYTESDIFEMELDITSDWELYVYIALFVLIVLPLIIFQYLALYNYTFKSPEIWSK